MFGLLRTTTLEFIEMRTEEGDVHSFAFARTDRSTPEPASTACSP